MHDAIICETKSWGILKLKYPHKIKDGFERLDMEYLKLLENVKNGFYISKL